MNFDLTKELLSGLPAYEGGRMSDGAYNAGGGLYDDRKTSPAGTDVFPSGIKISEADFRAMVESTKARGVNCYYENTENGISVRGEINDRLVRAQWIDGTVSVKYLDEPPSDLPDKSSFLRAVTETTADAFEAYVKKLVGLGFEQIYENRIENNLFRELIKDGRMIYAYFMANTGIARFVDDKVSERIDTYGYSYKPKKGEFPAVYQYGLYYTKDHRVAGVKNDCGMLYIIKLSDNSLFLIDGGEYEQATDAAVGDMMNLMHQITGTPENGKIRIAGWFCTHAHDDHMDVFGKLVKFHHDSLLLERVIFNFPAREYFGLAPQTYILIDRINEFYPDVKYLKPHSGQSFTLADVRFDFLQTHEDSVGAKGNELIGGFNDTSTILKITFSGKSLMILGDMDTSAETIFITDYSEKTLKSDMVQAAHHLINLLEHAYAVISPEIALVPQHPVFKTDHNNRKYEVLRRSVYDRNIYFAAEGTDGFRVDNGKLVRFVHRDVVGGEYDGSEV